MKNIVVVSSPRSGNTWLSRMLGDALDSPLIAWGRDGIDEPEYFGQGRDGKYLIRKSHDSTNLASWDKSVPTILVQRDPRDMVMSRIFYNQLEPSQQHIKDRIAQLTNLPDEFVYPNWINNWLADPRLTYQTTYENLHSLTYREIKNILDACGIEISPQRAKEVWEFQVFDKVKARYGDRFNNSMHKGVVGNWKSYFTAPRGEEITESIGEFMIEQDYIDNLDWWKELPDEL